MQEHTLKRLPKLDKASGLKRLPPLPGPKRGGRLPDLSEAIPQDERPTNAEEQRIARATGDEQLAKRVVKLQEEFAAGTVLELVIYDWLQMKRIAFQYQVALFGGRSRAGGLLPDFVIRRGAYSMAWLANGVYWHTRSGNEQADASAKMRLTGALAPDGSEINKTVLLWEDKVMGEATREQTLNLAMAGVELPH